MSPRPGGLLVAALLALSAPARADEADRCASSAEAGQRARIDGKLRSARERFIECSSEACPHVVRRDCARWLSEVETELPTVVLRARDASGQDVAAVRVLVDGVLLAERLEGAAVPVDAGEHTFSFERAGAPPVARKVIVQAGERARIVAVDLEPARPAPRPSRVGPIVLGTAGIASAVAGAVLWGIGTRAHDDLAATCAPEGLCATTDVDAARTKLIVGDVAMLSGALAIAGAVAWWLVATPSSPQARAQGPGVIRF